MIVASINKAEEKNKLSIPGQVFCNHFIAISKHLKGDIDAYDLKKVKYFTTKLFNKPGYELDRIKKLLWNSWSTEHALHLTAKQGNTDYCKYALHWSFPQAYYSCYLNMHAFCLAIGDTRQTHSDLIKAFGERVIKNSYPKSISFYADGNFEDYTVHNLPLQNIKSAISQIKSDADAQSQIATFLKSTRTNSAKYHREKRQNSSNPITTKAGTLCQSFNKEQWEIITNRLGPTTLFNILYRLRIKANYNDIESFMHADINFQQFHECLMDTVSYLNFVHESYLAKAVGLKKYAMILNGFPAHMSDSFVRSRYEQRIIPLIK
ncbi:hypothetical protein [Pontibacter burrus]|uniref:Uncharacterized protein n=1 Tax=Pontibacter burrus TaxID=2704466 RepID=A0A6B3LN14_9BACT|nr:hypothetical protein [Pontibacter burrus]NEM96455.1 hypothetical protein [Pontibacter burrus]